MQRSTTFLGTLLALILASTPALAQDDAGPEGPVGSAPGSEPDESSESPSGEDDPSDSSSDQSSEEVSGAEAMEGSRDNWDSTDTDDTAETTDHPSTVNFLVVAPHAGAAFHAFDDLGFWGTFGLEVGFLPMMKEMKDKPLEVALVARYTQPGATGSGRNPNLGPTGGNYDWEVTHRTLTLDGIALWRFRNLADTLAPYLLGGLRMNMTQTTLSGTAREDGSQFGELSETNTHVGIVGGFGTDIHVGPGTVFGEATVGWTKLDQNLTDLGSTTALALDIGYRFFPF